MLDAHRLRVFAAVVSQGSVHRAAELLGYTPSTISQHLAQLQRETGLTLLEKDGRGVAPTRAGVLLAREATEALGHLSDLDSFVQDLRDGRIGRLVIGHVASAGVALLPSVIGRLSEEFPDVRLELRLNEARRFSEIRPDIDIYILQPGQSVASDSFDHRELFDDPFLAVVPAGHRFAGRDFVTPGEVVGERLIDNDVAQGPCREAVLDLFRAAGADPVFGVEAHDYAAALEFVAAGVGLSIIPALGIRNPPPGVELVAIREPTPTRRVMLRTRRELRGSEVVDRAVELILEAASARPDPLGAVSRIVRERGADAAGDVPHRHST